jgi:hypothetical protein
VSLEKPGKYPAKCAIIIKNPAVLIKEVAQHEKEKYSD